MSKRPKPITSTRCPNCGEKNLNAPVEEPIFELAQGLEALLKDAINALRTFDPYAATRLRGRHDTLRRTGSPGP